MTTKRSPNVIFIKAEEMLGLPTGYYVPEVHDFRMNLYIKKVDDRVQVEFNGQTIKLEKDATLRLTRDGQMSNIHGPSHYDDPIRQEIARSAFGQSMFCYTDDRIELDYGQRAGVLSTSNNWNSVYGTIKANQGKLVIIYDDSMNVRGKAVYKKFIVRENYRNDDTVLREITANIARFPQIPSGAFQKALRTAWEPFCLEAAKDFRSNSLRKQVISSMYPQKTVQPI